MYKKSMVLTHALTILLAAFTISACSSDKSSEVNEIGNKSVFANNEKSPLILDSISSCIITPDSIDKLIALDKIYLKYFDGTWKLTFPANINDSQDKYIIETRSANDTLIVSMKRKKESTAVPDLAPRLSRPSLYLAKRRTRREVSSSYGRLFSHPL